MVDTFHSSIVPSKNPITFRLFFNRVKTIFPSLIIGVILLLPFLFYGCTTPKVEDEPKPAVPEIIPVFPDLINMDTSEFEVNVNDTISIIFTEEFNGFNAIYTIDSVTYIPFIRGIRIDDIQLDTIWSSRDTLKIFTKDLLPTNATLTLTIEYEWSRLSGGFKEFVKKQFSIKTLANTMPAEVVIASYPVDRQYYFLQGEYNEGFLLLERFPPDVSKLTITIEDKQGVIHTSPVSANYTTKRLDFSLPVFENETIYTIKLNNGQEVVYQIDFRTSMYNTLTEKLQNYTTEGRVYRHMLKAWMWHDLVQPVDITVEGFDKAEADYKIEESLELFEFRYCSGLLQLEFNPEGCDWYESYIYPIIYAPFSDPTFEPEYAYHPNLGRECQYAMAFYFDGELNELTDAEISSGVANPSFMSQFKVKNFVPAAAGIDYFYLRESAKKKYFNTGDFDNRLYSLFYQNFVFVYDGIYKYNINYKLPDGTITSSQTYEMALALNYYQGG